MIQKYVYGTPFPTEAVISDLPEAAGVPAYGCIETENGFCFTYLMKEDDIVYGLGEANRGLNKRGYCYISDCTDDPRHTEDKRSLYGAHNLIVIAGEQNFGLFFDYPSKITFDIGYTKRNLLRVSCGNADLNLFVIDGDSPYEIVKQFRKSIGRSYIPPKYAFGFGQSRWGYKTKEDFRKVVQGYREHHIPLDMVYMDIDYMQDFKDFTWNEENFPDFPDFVQEMKSRNIRLIPIIDAGVKIEEGYDIYEEGVRNRYFCQREDGSDFVAAVWPGDTHFPDVLNPEARAWFGDKYRLLIDQGIEGFWNDMNEPAIFYSPEGIAEVKTLLKQFLENGEAGGSKSLTAGALAADRKPFSAESSTAGKTAGEPSAESPEESAEACTSIWPIMAKINALANSKEDYRNFYHMVNGKKVRHDQIHNLFGYYMTRAAGEAFERIAPEKRFLMFSRSSYIGMHRYGGIWTGDNKSWWAHILLNLKMMPSLNMCGFLYTGADLGGFGADATEDLLLRWLALGVFTPLMRNHAAQGTREQECYQFEDLDSFRHIIQVRYRLVPYLYSEYMKAALQDDLYFKPLAFVYPKDRTAVQAEDQMMLGNEIMIAPVYTQNARGRYVYLPEEMKFVKFLPDGTVSEEILKKGHHYVEIALNEVPLFIRSGKCIPVAEPAECMDDLDTEHLTLLGYKDAEYTLYEDDGIRKAYEKPENYRVIKNI